MPDRKANTVSTSLDAAHLAPVAESSDGLKSKLVVAVMTAVLTTGLTAGSTFFIMNRQLARTHSYWEEQQKLLRYQKLVDRMGEELDHYLQAVSTAQTLRSDLVNHLQHVRLSLTKYRSTAPPPETSNQIAMEYSKKFLDFAASFNSLVARLVTIKVLFDKETMSAIDAALANISDQDGKVLKSFYPPEPALLTVVFREAARGDNDAIAKLDGILATYLANEHKTPLVTTIFGEVLPRMARAVKNELENKK